MAESDLLHESHNSFLPHGTCISWDVPLLSLYVISDLLIALAYFSLPLAIIYFVRRRKTVAFKPAYYLFALFIASCGLTHILSIVTLWYPLYYLAGVMKAITATVSIISAIYVIPLLSGIVSLPDLKQLVGLNSDLEKENEQRQRIEKELLASQHTLDEANQLLKTVLDAVPERLFWKDTNLNYLGANRLFLEDCGLHDVTEIIGKNDFDMPWTQEQSESYREDDKLVIETLTAKLNFEEQQLDSSGHVKWVLTSKHPLINSSGEVIGMLGTYRDITQRKVVEQELINSRHTLDESNQLLKTVIDAVPDRLFWKDTNLNYLGANRLFLEDCGLHDVTEIIGKNDFDMPWTQEQSESYREDDRNVIETVKEKVHIEQTQLDSRGKIKWILSNKVPLINSLGEVIGILGTYDDISERKLMEQGLIEAKEIAEEASSAKSQFLSRMSHELRTPLNGILGFAQLLESEDLTEDQLSSVEMIFGSGKHLLDLINDILQVAALESGKLTVSIEPLELESILHEVLSSIETLLFDNQISLYVEGDRKLWVEADHTRLKQLLYNLLSNAVKYNKFKGTVTVLIALNQDKVRMSISDTGKGIRDENIDSIFEPFNRLNYENSVIEGTGIGLTISQQLAYLMGTKLNVDSTVDVGTTFWFDLPKATPMPDYQVTSSEIEQLALRDESDCRLTLLYVEDNKANMKLIRHLVSNLEDVILVEAIDAEEGIEKAQMFRPDLILMDINLPGKDGYHALSEIKQLSMKKNLKIVAVSANAMTSEIEQGYQAGFDDYITKPIDLDEITQLIETMKIELKQRSNHER